MFQHRFQTFAALLLVALVSLGANCKNSNSESADKDSEEKAAADSPGEEVATDIYPDFPMQRLDPDERRQLVEVTKSELCPCPDSTQSLHKCMQTREDRCGLALQAVSTAAQSIEAGLNSTDTRSKVVEVIEAAKKTYEFKLKNVPHKGPQDAPVKIVEFADFQCPHCKRASEVMDKVVEKYGDKIVFYFKNFPLSGHPKAEMAARAALAAHQQDMFWEMHDRLFAHQKSLSQQKILGFASQLGMNKSTFKQDMQNAMITSQVRADKKEGMDANIKSTPSIFINGRRYLGPKTVEGISKRIDQVLVEQKKGDGGDSSEKEGDETAQDGSGSEKGASKEPAEKGSDEGGKPTDDKDSEKKSGEESG